MTSRSFAELQQVARTFAQTADTTEEAVVKLLGFCSRRPHLNEMLRARAARDLIHEARALNRAALEACACSEAALDSRPAQGRSNAGAQPARAAWAIPESAIRRQEGIAQVRSAYYDWRLPNSDTKLGDATLADLDAARHWHEAAACGELRRAALYAEIAELLKRSNKRIVRDAIPEDRLAALIRKHTAPVEGAAA